jgi:hypothetical protein
MQRSVFTLAAALAATLGTTLFAQKTTDVHPGKAGSPHVRTEWVIDGANISIEYGRPFLKGRAVGKEVAPIGKPWRAGADEATTLKTDKPLKIGALALPAGTYTIYTVPGEKEWELIISKATGQWGVPYPGEGQDFGRTAMQVGTTKAPVEQLTFSIDDTPKGGVLRLEWGTTSATAPFTVG